MIPCLPTRMILRLFSKRVAPSPRDMAKAPKIPIWSDARGGSMGSAWPSWPTMAHWCQHVTHGTHAPHATHVLTRDRRKSWWLAATKWNSRRSTAGCSWYPRLPGVKNYVCTICTIVDGCGTDSGARWNCWRLVTVSVLTQKVLAIDLLAP